MDFNLERDLVFFDLEATGLNVVKDRIVQIAMIKYFKKDKPPVEFSMLINPGIPISLEAMEVHGITPKDVANKPTFQQVADKIHEFIGNADLAGYNSNRYDIPLLLEEFARVGIELDMSRRKTLDMQRIFYKMEPRTLSAAYKFYCGKKMENAHDALADVRATAAVFKGQLEMYKDVDYEDADGNIIEKPIRNDMKAIQEFSNDNRFLDATQRLKYNSEGIAVFNFGKYAGQPVVEVLRKDKPYYTWIITKDFSSQVKQIVKQLVKEDEKK
ncbi:MAG: 3'-5' exonuclease [Bacteroidota bacterium]